MHTIYTVGYLGMQPEALLAHVERLGALLIDVRYVAWSRAPRWRPTALKQLVGESNYLWLKALGNVNYRSGGPVQLADPASVVEQVRAILHERPVILLCACSDIATCHRRDAALYLAAQCGAPVVLTPDAEQ
jgi:uncharacterized protein (DUF488 family)